MASRTAAAEVVVPEQFPVGLRVLVVDDHIPCLRIVEQMLRKCKYNVTTCSQATGALNLLRERKGCFDIVLSDVHMPDMDGFKLLELVGLEMGLPVIMMSADGRTNLVLRGVRHGACDYLIKPIREEELKNIWQHVVRKRWSGIKEHENSGGLEDNDRDKRGSDDAEYASSVNEGAEGVSTAQKKRKDAKEEDEAELECDDPTTAKKARVVWSVELHQQFVSAVNQLGIDKAVPKRILELMNVPGLTRENVASHLQKFRLYLKRLSGVAQQQGGLPNSFCGPLEANPKMGSLGRFDIQALAASGQIPPETMAALHTELFNRSAGTLVFPITEQPPLLQGAKCVPEQSVAYVQPLMRCPSNISNHFIQSTGSTEDVTSGNGMWPSKDLGNVVVPSSKVSGLIPQSGNVLLSMVQNQQQRQSQQQEQQENQYVLLEPSRSINVQPSCIVVPSNLSGNFQAGSPASVNQKCSFSRSSVMDYGILSPQSHNSSAVAQVSATEFKPMSLPSGFSGAGSASPSMSCGSTSADKNAGWQVPNSASTFVAPRQLHCLASNMLYMQGSYNIKSGQLLDHGAVKNIGVTNRGTTIPSRFAVNEPELLLGNLNHGVVCGENSGNRIKLEPNTDFTENAKVGIPPLQHIPANDLMSVSSD